MMTNKLFFETLKEHRGAYFVEYGPPISDHKFATLNIVFPSEVDVANLQALMESELKIWIGRFPVPLMVWAFDDSGSVIHLSKELEHCLVGWRATDGQIEHSWNLHDLTRYLETAPPHPDWSTIYTDVPFRTGQQVKAEAEAKFSLQQKQMRALKIVLVLWLAVIPASLAIMEFLGPEWLGALVLTYSLGKAWRVAARIWGWSKPTQLEAEEAEKKRKMDHYYYHCELNPDGFLKLRSENFTKDLQRQTKEDSEKIAGLHRSQ